ncbi:MAG: DUF3099 domain-containing protein [Propionibacteriaceae bacterium]|nr:DUF3099 domain-containing protein [Propionibacteriaceae bacterium]
MPLQPVLITGATPGRTLDVNTRQKRYLITMGIRVACFLLMFVLPGAWMWVALAGAAFLPAIAVLFANNSEHRPPPVAPEDAGVPRLALSGPNTIPGEIDD